MTHVREVLYLSHTWNAWNNWNKHMRDRKCLRTQEGSHWNNWNDWNSNIRREVLLICFKHQTPIRTMEQLEQAHERPQVP